MATHRRTLKAIFDRDGDHNLTKILLRKTTLLQTPRATMLKNKFLNKEKLTGSCYALLVKV